MPDIFCPPNRGSGAECYNHRLWKGKTLLSVCGARRVVKRLSPLHNGLINIDKKGHAMTGKLLFRTLGAMMVATTSLALAPPLLSQTQPANSTASTHARADIILRGGTIYTGSAAPFVGDVAITADRITYVGPRARGTAERVIDARGLVVAPGFIDPHTHIDGQLRSADADARLVPGFLMQGVTTAFIGVDGNGHPDVAATLARAADPLRRVGVNYATYIGLGGLRSHVVGAADRAPTAEEMTRMRGLVQTAMCSGALGLSTGLFYAPQSYARQDEVVTLAREAARLGGIYDSHIRDESSYTIGLMGAIDEALTVGREAQMPVHIAHIKALGVDVQGQADAVIARI